MKRTFFFLGKGGVGKSTISASLAYYLSKKNHKIYLGSIDPAHNLYDIFALSPFKGIKQIDSSLWLEEVDIDDYLKNFLKKTETQMKQIYAYLQVFNLEKMFDLIKNAPGMEEMAIMYALKDILEKQQDMDYLIIDTPPTGLMLKIFTLPFVTKLWLERLLVWRKKILQSRQSIAHIKGKDYFGSNVAITFKEDKVLAQLTLHQRTVDFLLHFFIDKKKSQFFLVINPDKLSLHEGKRIVETLNKLNIHIDLVLLNKTGITEIPPEISFFKDFPLKEIPFLKQKLDKEGLLKLASYWAKDVY